jgi:hypothetical protein
LPTDLTGTPTSLGIGTYNVDADAPSGLGFNAAMAQIDALIASRIGTPAGITTGEIPVWNGSTWVRSSTQRPAQSSLGTGTPSISTFLRGDVAWAPAVGSPYRKTTAKQIVNTTSVIDLLNGEVTIAAGAMGTDRVLRLTAWGDSKQNSGAGQFLPSFILQMGGTPLLNTNTVNAWSSNANRAPWRVVCEIMNLGVANSQWVSMDVDFTGTIASGGLSGFFTGEGFLTTVANYSKAVGGNSEALDTTVAQSLQFMANLPIANAAVDITLKGAVVEIL